MNEKIRQLKAEYAAGRCGPAWQRLALEIVSELEAEVSRLEAETPARGTERKLDALVEALEREFGRRVF